MSWTRLLKTGRSISGMNKQNHRYRLTQGNLIPKFGNAKQGRPASVAPAARSATPTSVATARADRSASFDLWKPFAALSGLFTRKEIRATRLAPFPRPPLVQAELSLDALKPVRNDLSDSDFEIRLQPVASVSAAPASAPGLLARAKAILP